jgi:hypothetical protein
MSIDIQKYVKLRTVVSYFLDQWDKSAGDEDKAWLIALRGYVDIGFNVAFEPLSVRLQVNGNQTVTLPPDYITWTKIGCINASNEVSSLKVNTALSKLKDTNPNRVSYLNPDVQDMDFGNLVLNPYFLNYYFGNWYTPLFGLGNGLVQYGSVVVDEANGVIVLGPGYPFNDLLLEYISSPERNDDYMVLTCYQEAIIAFLEWKFKLGTETAYYNRVMEGRRKDDPIRLQVLNDVIRSQSGYKVKV